MAQPIRCRPDAVLRGYIHAKDETRPHRLRQVFANDAVLQIQSRAAFTLPAATHGREAIAEVLVRRFAQTYENIYTFYMGRPPAQATQFSCDWLVGMSAKHDGSVHVGCGRYDWHFRSEEPCFADRLVITIEAMQVLSSEYLEPVFRWLTALPYPWGSAEVVLQTAPEIRALAPILTYISRDGWPPQPRTRP